MTPWTLLSRARPYWERSYRGGAIAAFRLGPKESRVEVVGHPLAEIPYWRTSFRGTMRALGQSFCQHAMVRELPWRASDPVTASCRVSWV